MAELLNGRRAFRFGEVGSLALKGFAAPVAAYEVHYERDDPAAVLRHTPFTGRAGELACLERRLEEARGGRGGGVMLVGEPGIGKTRTLEEFAETARALDALVLWGRCYEGEAARRPYGPFVGALTEHVRSASPEMLRADLGVGAAPLTRLVPVLRERLPDLPEPVSLQPHEERTRLIDAVTQSLLRRARGRQRSWCSTTCTGRMRGRLRSCSMSRASRRADSSWWRARTVTSRWAVSTR